MTLSLTQRMALKHTIAVAIVVAIALPFFDALTARWMIISGFLTTIFATGTTLRDRNLNMFSTLLITTVLFYIGNTWLTPWRTELAVLLCFAAGMIPRYSPRDFLLGMFPAIVLLLDLNGHTYSAAQALHTSLAIFAGGAITMLVKDVIWVDKSKHDRPCGNPSRIVFYRAIRLALGVALSLYIANKLGWSRPSWAAISYIFVSRTSLASATRRIVQRISATIVGLVIGFVLVHFAGMYSAWLLALAPVCLYFTYVNITEKYFIAIFFVTMLLAIVFAQMVSGHNLLSILEARLYETVLGAVLGFLSQLLLFRESLLIPTRESIRDLYTAASCLLTQLTAQIKAGKDNKKQLKKDIKALDKAGEFLASAYPDLQYDPLYLFSKRIHRLPELGKAQSRLGKALKKLANFTFNYDCTTAQRDRFLHLLTDLSKALQAIKPDHDVPKNQRSHVLKTIRHELQYIRDSKHHASFRAELKSIIDELLSALDNVAQIHYELMQYK